MSSGRRLGIAVAVAATLLVAAAPAGATSIGGTVTDASTHEGIEGVLVCAYEPSAGQSEAEAGKKCSESEENGEYVIGGGVPDGSYKVGFHPGSGSKYAPEFFNDVGSWEEADVIDAQAPATGIDAALDEVKSDEGPDEEGGSGDEVDSGDSPLPPLIAAPPAILPVPPKPPPLRCRKGFRKKKVKGKLRCVKVRPVKHRRARGATGSASDIQGR